MYLMKKIIRLKLILVMMETIFFVAFADAQTSFRGIISSYEVFQPIAGVRVFLSSNPAEKNVTDDNGSYELSLPDSNRESVFLIMQPKNRDFLPNVIRLTDRKSNLILKSESWSSADGLRIPIELEQPKRIDDLEIFASECLTETVTISMDRLLVITLTVPEVFPESKEILFVIYDKSLSQIATGSIKTDNLNLNEENNRRFYTIPQPIRNLKWKTVTQGSDITPKGILTFRVFDENIKPFEGVRLIIDSKRYGDAVIKGKTAADGSFSTQIPIGKYYLTLSKRGYVDKFDSLVTNSLEKSINMQKFNRILEITTSPPDAQCYIGEEEIPKSYGLNALDIKESYFDSSCDTIRMAKKFYHTVKWPVEILNFSSKTVKKKFTLPPVMASLDFISRYDSVKVQMSNADTVFPKKSVLPLVEFPRLQAGHYKVKFKCPGYDKKVDTLTVQPNNKPYEVVLKKKPPLPPVFELTGLDCIHLNMTFWNRSRVFTRLPSKLTQDYRPHFLEMQYRMIYYKERELRSAKITHGPMVAVGFLAGANAPRITKPESPVYGVAIHGGWVAALGEHLMGTFSLTPYRLVYLSGSERMGRALSTAAIPFTSSFWSRFPFNFRLETHFHLLGENAVGIIIENANKYKLEKQISSTERLAVNIWDRRFGIVYTRKISAGLSLDAKIFYRDCYEIKIATSNTVKVWEEKSKDDNLFGSMGIIFKL